MDFPKRHTVSDSVSCSSLGPINLEALRLRFRFTPSKAHKLAANYTGVWLGALKNQLRSTLELEGHIEQLMTPENLIPGSGASRPNTQTPGMILRASSLPVPDLNAGHLHITLFGAASKHAQPVILSLFQAGNKGLGRGHEQWNIDQLEAMNALGTWEEIHIPVVPDDVLPWCHPARVWCTVDRKPEIETASKASSDMLALVFQDRCILMEKGKTILAPSMSLLMERILERYTRICRIWGNDPEPVKQEEIDGLMTVAKAVALLPLSMGQKSSIKVRSGRQSNEQGRDVRYPSEGFFGTFVYQGPVKPLIPWLRLGSMIHIGQQTSFGLGHYHVLFE